MTHVVRFLIAPILLISSALHAQTECLIIQKSGTEKVKYFAPGKRVKLETVAGHRIKGRLSVNQGQVIVDGTSIDPNDIYFIRTKSQASIVVGGVFEGLGAIFTTMGGILIVDGLTNPDECASTITLLMGVPLTLGSVVFLHLPGTIMLLTGKKHKTGKWQFSVGPYYSKRELREQKHKSDAEIW